MSSASMLTLCTPAFVLLVQNGKIRPLKCLLPRRFQLEDIDFLIDMYYLRIALRKELEVSDCVTSLSKPKKFCKSICKACNLVEVHQTYITQDYSKEIDVPVTNLQCNTRCQSHHRRQTQQFPATDKL